MSAELTTLMANDLEACLINVLLTHHDKQGYIFDNCEATFFKDAQLSRIFEIAASIYAQNGCATNVDVFEKDRSLGDTISAVITQPIAYASMTSYYCKKLYERRLEALISEAKSENELEAVKEFKRKYATLDYKIKHISDGVEDFEEKYTKKQKNSVMTGYSALDEKIGSFMGGDFIALGGCTGMGKTAVALNIANMLCLQDKKVLYFSLEMTLEQLQNRFVCMVMGLDGRKFRSFGFNKQEMELYKTGLKGLKEWNLDVVCDFALTPEKMKIYAENQKRKGLDFIILDYLGLMSTSGNRSLYEKMTLLSRQVKLIATELEIPILVLVQLNREMKNRAEKRPVLSDIRESGAIEQDADYVLFAYRDWMYNPQASQNDIEIIIAKNRHGENNVIAKLDFDLKTQTIKDKWNDTTIQETEPKQTNWWQ
jgi:replicative DNA helicase